MAYKRLNLTNGKKFTAAHVQHIEDGIVGVENAIPAGAMEITVEYDGTTTSSATFEEIEAAIAAGAVPHVRLAVAEEGVAGYFYAPLVLHIPGEQVVFSAMFGTTVITALYLVSGVVQVNIGEV